MLRAWYLYLHNWVMFAVNFGKHSSTMELLDVEFVGYLYVVYSVFSMNYPANWKSYYIHQWANRWRIGIQVGCTWMYPMDPNGQYGIYWLPLGYRLLFAIQSEQPSELRWELLDWREEERNSDWPSCKQTWLAGHTHEMVDNGHVKQRKFRYVSNVYRNREVQEYHHEIYWGYWLIWHVTPWKSNVAGWESPYWSRSIAAKIIYTHGGIWKAMFDNWRATL